MNVTYVRQIFPWENITAHTTLMVISIVGFASYAVCLIAVMKERMYVNPYYALMVGLGISELTGLSVYMCYGFIATMVLSQNIGPWWPSALGGVLLNTGWFSALSIICMLAINRTICLRSNSAAKRTTSLTTWLQIVSCHIFGLAIGLPSFNKCCYLILFPLEFGWLYVGGVGTMIIARIELACLGIVGTILIVCFVLSFSHIYRWRKYSWTIVYLIWKLYLLQKLSGIQPSLSVAAKEERKKQLQEIKLFLQVFLTTLNLVMFELFFQIAPRYSSSIRIGYLSSVFHVSTCTNNGFVHLSMNTSIRQAVKRLFKRSSHTVQWAQRTATVTTTRV